MSKELDALRKQKMQSIKDCDFLQAKAIDAQINQLINTLKTQKIDNENSHNKLQYSIEREAARSDMSTIYNEHYNKLFGIKTEYQKRKTNLQRRYSEAITKTEEEYAKELELATTRTIPEADTMKKEAQIRAKNGEFDDANNLYIESNDLREKIIKERQNKVHDKYSILISQIENKQKEDFECLNSKENQGYTEVFASYEEEVKRNEKRLQVASIRLSVTRSPSEERNIFKVLEFEGMRSREEPKEAPQKEITFAKTASVGTPKRTPKSPRTPKSKFSPSVTSPI